MKDQIKAAEQSICLMNLINNRLRCTGNGYGLRKPWSSMNMSA